MVDASEYLVDERGERRKVFGREESPRSGHYPFWLRFRGLTPLLPADLVGRSHHCISVLGGQAGDSLQVAPVAGPLEQAESPSSRSIAVRTSGQEAQ